MDNSLAAINSDREILSVTEAAEYLRVSKSALRLWLKDGRIAHFRAGRLVRIRRSAIEAFTQSTASEGGR